MEPNVADKPPQVLTGTGRGEYEVQTMETSSQLSFRTFLLAGFPGTTCLSAPSSLKLNGG